METIENIQQQTINLYELPTGKQSFIATIGAVRIEKEHDYWYNVIDVPYIYLKNIRIFLNNSWFNVEQSGNFVSSKVGKRLQKLKLEENDIIAFDAIVEAKNQPFCKMEGRDFVEDENYDTFILPQSYNGRIIVTIYHVQFNKKGYKACEMEYERKWDRKYFDEHYDDFTKNEMSQITGAGDYKNIISMSFTGRILKNFSNIEKY